VQDAAGSRLGHEALARLLPPVGGLDAGKWLTEIIETVAAHAAGAEFPDDIAAFAAVYKG
jgi:hypothetical protein